MSLCIGDSASFAHSESDAKFPGVARSLSFAHASDVAIFCDHNCLVYSILSSFRAQPTNWTL